MFGNMQLDSFMFGIISAASLPLGAAIAMFWTPNRKISAGLMAFGGGALLAALTIDLVAEAVSKGEFYFVAGGAIMGGILYEVLNYMLNMQGGFMRKRSTAMRHVRRKHLKELKLLFKRMGVLGFLRHLPHDEVHKLVPFLSKRHLKAGHFLFNQGDLGDEVFVVESGEVQILNANQQLVETLKSNQAWGEIKFLKQDVHHETAKVLSDSIIWVLHKSDLERVAAKSQPIREALDLYLSVHVEQQSVEVSADEIEIWSNNAMEHAHDPCHHEIAAEGKKHGNAALAIWLGILLDGIPESFVIGASFLVGTQAGHGEAAAGLSLSLLAGLFLSNFPEALSSSVGMRENHYSKFKIMAMWTSLMIITGLGALLGNFLLDGASPTIFPIIQGMAAGAMLTMIAETMLPEAFEKGGAVTGLSTLMGFLTAIFFKEIG